MTCRNGRYGVMPGYGISLQDGFEDTFTATAMGALEMGAFPYAKGVIDNHLKYYVRSNGMTTYEALMTHPLRVFFFFFPG